MKKVFLLGIPVLVFCLAICPLALADEDIGAASNPEKIVFFSLMLYKSIFFSKTYGAPCKL